MPYPVLQRSFNISSVIRDMNKEDNSNIGETEAKVLLVLSHGAFTLTKICTYYKAITGNQLHYSLANSYLSPLIDNGYVIKQGKQYLITPSGLLILSRLEKRLKRIR